MIITKFQNLKIIWTRGSNLAFPDTLNRNVAIEEYQKHQLQHIRIPRDIESFDENGTPVSYQIQHEDNPNDTCNAFYPIKYKRDTEEKLLRVQNDGEDLTISSILDDFPILSIEQVSDCFRMGKFIKQFRQICGPDAPSSVSANTSNTDYSSINSLSSSEDDDANQDNHCDISPHLDTDSEDDIIVCDISIQADKPGLCQAKQAHELVLGKTDTSLARKQLTVSDAPH